MEVNDCPLNKNNCDDCEHGELVSAVDRTVFGNVSKIIDKNHECSLKKCDYNI